MLATIVAGTGCVSPQSVEPVTSRARFQRLREQVRGQPVGALQVVVERVHSLAPPPGDGDVRAVSVDPDERAATHELVNALGALGLFKRVSDDLPLPGPDVPVYRLVVTPARSTVEWVGMANFAWANFLLWGTVGPASWFVADEVFAGCVEWDLRLQNAAGDTLATTHIAQRSEVYLNDFDRGFSLWDLLIYAAAPINESRLQRVGPMVMWFTDADATLAVCEWMVAEARSAIPPPEQPVAPTPGPTVPVPVEPVPPPPVEPPPPPPVEPPPTAPRWRVLCVGVDHYAADLRAPGAAEDARALGAVLQGRLEGKDAEVTVLADDAATGPAVAAWLAAREAEGLGATDHVWITFAGRGATGPDGEPVLVLHEGRCTEGGIAVEAPGALPLRRLVRACEAAGEVTVVLDCAFQGRADERGPDIDRAPWPVARIWPESVRVLAASWAEGEATQADGGHGLFTAMLLRALDGAADLDGDGRLSLAEAESYCAREVRAAARVAGVDERPSLLSGPPTAVLFPTN